MSDTTQETESLTRGAKRQASLLSHVGLVAALAALVGASCCALPLVLASAGLAGAWIANLGMFVVYRPHITAVALVVIAVGWAIALRRQAFGRTFLVLGLATAIVLAALAVAHYEAEITRYLVSLRRK
jgi:mercuric ion transport protein